MNTLNAEITRVFEELKPLLEEEASRKKPEPLNARQALALLEKLEPMLENINPECVDLLDELLAVPGAEDLVKQIDNFDFKSAAKTLAELKEKLKRECE